MDIEPILAKFLSYQLKIKRKNALTVAHYRAYLMHFVEIQKVTRLTDISESNVKNFTKHLKAKRLLPSTQNYYLIALRSFIRWLPKEKRPIDYRSIWLMPIIRTTTPPLSRSVVQTILSDEKGVTRSLQSLRNRALIEILLSVDVKLYELPPLRITDYDPRRRTLSCGTPARMLLLSNHACFYLDEYVRRRSDAAPFLFIRHDRAARAPQAARPMTTRSIQRLVQNVRAHSGLQKPLTVRSLQKTRQSSS